MEEKSTITNEKAELAGVFNRAAPTYDQVGPRYFTYFGQRLVDLAGLEPGSGLKVLDVATGRGSVLFPIARRIGSTGQVIGIDLAEGMIEQTSKDVARRGLENITLLQMDAEYLNFEKNFFDMLFCGFGVFFFPHLRQALAEFYRVLKPGGRVAISTWGASDPRWSWLSEVGLRPSAGPRTRPPTTDSSRSTDNSSAVHRNNSDWLKNSLIETGFTLAREETENEEFFYSSEEEWWATEWSHSVRKFLEKLDEEQLVQARKASTVHLQKIKQPQGLPVNYQAMFTVAVKSLT